MESGWEGRNRKKLGFASREDSNSGIFQQLGFHGNNSSNLEGAWGVEIKEGGRNLYTFRFLHENDRAQVEEGGSWCFDRRLVVLNLSMNIEENPGKVNLNRCPFWIRVYDFLVGFSTKEIAERVGKSMGNFIKWDKCNEI